MTKKPEPATAYEADRKRARTPRRRAGGSAAMAARHVRGALAIAGATIATVLLAACGSNAGTSAQSSPTSPAPTDASSTGAAEQADYELHMVFFSQESKISPAIDPQVFVAAPGAKAGIGPQMIKHSAGVAPAKQAGPPTAALLAANATPLKITLDQWKKAAGTVTFSCLNGNERAASTLTGLIPSATYSTFVVHLKIQGAGRFTPWGNAAGTDNNFTASSTGTASPTNTVPGCLGPDSAAVIIWHSDGQTHGSTPGTIGVTWHNSLIVPLP